MLLYKFHRSTWRCCIIEMSTTKSKSSIHNVHGAGLSPAFIGDGAAPTLIRGATARRDKAAALSFISVSVTWNHRLDNVTGLYVKR